MALTLDGKNIFFSVDEFESLCTQVPVDPHHRIVTDLMADLLQLLKNLASAEKIKSKILLIPMDDRQRYKKAIRYILFTYPYIQTRLVKSIPIAYLNSGHLFDEYIAALTRDNADYVDLLYGINSSRTLAIYSQVSEKLKGITITTTSRSGIRGLFSRRIFATTLTYENEKAFLQTKRKEHVTVVDNFNNELGIGTGGAFRRQWDGLGLLDSTPQSTMAFIEDKAKNATKASRREFFDGLKNSRYSPSESYRPELNLQKDRHISEAELNRFHPILATMMSVPDSCERHAMFVNSVRRSCKYGIAMVVSNPSYQAVQAKVHFVLDGLGDLGKLAYKVPTYKDTPKKSGEFNQDYVAITTSELCFCARYWDQVKNTVIFYVNGREVPPPWEADYTVASDATGSQLYSNQEAWLCYQLSHEIFGKKPFPLNLS